MRCFVENKVTTACNLGARAEKNNDDLFYYACSQRVELSVYEQVKSIHKQQTTIRKPIECAPEASSGGRESMEMTEGGP